MNHLEYCRGVPSSAVDPGGVPWRRKINLKGGFGHFGGFGGGVPWSAVRRLQAPRKSCRRRAMRKHGTNRILVARAVLWRGVRRGLRGLGCRGRRYHYPYRNEEKLASAVDDNSPAAARLCRAEPWTEKPRCNGVSRKPPASRLWTKNTPKPCRVVPGPGLRGGAAFFRREAA